MTATTTDPTGEIPVAVATDGGDDKLAAAASKLRSRTSVPVDKGFQVVAAALIGIGILAIVGGWYGVSHTAREWRQTPYLVSGGLLGLALVVVGGVGYLGFWLTKLVESANRQTAVLERLERHLGGGVAEATSDALVVAGGLAHRADCPLLVGKDDLRPLGERERGVRACAVCEPDLPAPTPVRAKK